MRHAVDIFHIRPLVRRHGGLRLIEPAPRRQDLVPALGNLDVVFLDLGMRLLAQDARVHIGKMPHVEEILDRPPGRHLHPEDSRHHKAPVRLVKLGKRKQRRRCRPETGPDIAVLHQGLHRRAVAQHARTARRADDLDRPIQQHGAAPPGTAQFIQRHHRVPMLQHHRIGAGLCHHVVLLGMWCSSASSLVMHLP